MMMMITDVAAGKGGADLTTLCSDSRLIQNNTSSAVVE